MREIVGVVKSLGASKVIHSNLNSGTVIYSTIEIGENILQKIGVARSLNNYLERALNVNSDVKFYLVGRDIFGIEFPDGKIYYQKSRNLRFFFTLIFPVFIAILSIFLLVTDGKVNSQAKNWSLAILIPFGLMSIILIVAWWKQSYVARKLKSKKGIGISA